MFNEFGRTVSMKPYLELPLDLVDPGLGLDLALEVDVVLLLDVGRVQRGAELERGARQVCKKEGERRGIITLQLQRNQMAFPLLPRRRWR